MRAETDLEKFDNGIKIKNACKALFRRERILPSGAKTRWDINNAPLLTRWRLAGLKVQRKTQSKGQALNFFPSFSQVHDFSLALFYLGVHLQSSADWINGSEMVHK